MSTKLSKKVWVPSQEEIGKELAWIKNAVEEIGEDEILDLAKKASVVRKNAYQPYSGYQVGATILTTSGNRYSGCNAEAVTFTETDHAERSAISTAIAQGEINKSGNKFIKALAVSHQGEAGPCGGCRQKIAEHADNALIIDTNKNGEIQRITSLNMLFLYSFRPSHLGK